MNYNEFVCAVKREVEELVGRDMRVELHTAMKNNGKERVGLAISEERVNVSPAIYLDEYYDMWKEGKTIREIANHMVELYDTVRFHQSWNVEEFHKYEAIKGKMACKLINYEQNRELLQDTPHIKYIDLAIVFYLLVDISSQGTSTMLIKKMHQEAWGVTVEELYRNAMTNMEKMLPFCFQTMSSVVNELIEEKNEVEVQEEWKVVKKEERMYVLSNKERNFGAATLLYKGKLALIGKLLEEDFYILPSSVHEVIILPISKAPDRNEIDLMIRDINETQVMDEEVLSNHSYYYDCKRGMVLY